jgi:hypothetical protein
VPTEKPVLARVPPGPAACGPACGVAADTPATPRDAFEPGAATPADEEAPELALPAAELPAEVLPDEDDEPPDEDDEPLDGEPLDGEPLDEDDELSLTTHPVCAGFVRPMPWFRSHS